ncbi:MAG: hypothetical protein ACRD0V_02195 [Acidimicrobiales bacterium]
MFTGRGRVKSAALYQAFLGWATGEGERFDLSNRAFTAAMEARGYKRRATKAGAVWDGVALVCADFEAPNGGHAL